MNIVLCSFLLLTVASTPTAFLPVARTVRSDDRHFLFAAKSSDHGENEGRVPVGKKQRYVHLDAKKGKSQPPSSPAGKTKTTTHPETTPRRVTSLAQLRRDYQALKEKLKHDLYKMKHQQVLVSRKEDQVLQKTIDQIEFRRFAQEMDVEAAQEDYESVHEAVEHAKQTTRVALQHWKKAQAAWNKQKDLQALVTLGKRSEELRNSEAELKFRQKDQQKAVHREAFAEDLLEFLEQQEVMLREIAQDPNKEQQWIQQELIMGHDSLLLRVAALEWETEQLVHQLRVDLLQLKHLQVLVEQEEELMVTKQAEIAALETQEQQQAVQAALDLLQRTRGNVKKAVARKEDAYKRTLLAMDYGDRHPDELWKISETAKELSAYNEAADAAKETLARASRRFGGAS